MSFTAQRNSDILEIRILGGLEVVRDGCRHSLPASRKTRGLLAYLALAVRPCRREDLCDLLWDDVADPRGELRWSLSKLRALLGPWLVASQNGIAIAGEGLTVDVTAFRRLAASIRSEYDAREALALWRGEPLADAEVPGSHRFHLWWTAEREALTKLHCRVLHERVDRLWSSPCDALAAARSLVTRYPFDEWGHARVAQALKRTGRIPEARAYVEATRQTLSLELGLPPASVMMELPKEPYGLAIPRSTAPARERGALRPLVGVLPLQIMPREEALHAVATHVASEIAHGLWRSGICDVVELDCQASGNVLQGPELSYALRGNLMQLKDELRLSLRCVEPRRGTVLWFAQFGPDRSTTGWLAGWIGKAVGALQSSIQIAEMHRAQECSSDPDQGVRDLLLKALALSAAPEPVANRQALAFLDAVLTEEPDEPRALALAAWCHAQRCVYNWSANPDGDRGDAERFIKAASHLGMNDPNCLTVLAAARSQVADQTHAGMLLSRALQLNPHSSWAHARSGYVAVYQDQPERAVHHFRAALRLAPLDPATFNSMAGLGIAYFIKGEHRRAIDWMEQGLALSPKATWIYRNLVPAYIAVGRQAEAERGLHALLDEYPGLSVAAVRDAMVLSRPTMARITDGLSQAGLPRS